MDGPRASPEELTIPRVRPFRALRRTAVALVIIPVVLALLWLEWDRRITCRLDARVAEYRQRGEPTRVAEFESPALPDDRNALVHLRRAAAALPHEAEVSLFHSPLYADVRHDSIGVEIGRRLIAQAGPGLDLLPPALACPAAAWRSPARVSFADPGPADDVNEDWAIDRWMPVLITASTLAHVDRDDDAAVAHAIDALTLSRLRATNPSWRAQQSRAFYDRQIARQVVALAGALHVEHDPADAVTIPFPASGRGAPRTPVTRERAADLIDALLDDEPARRAVVRALYAIRCDLYENPRTTAAVRRPLRYWNDRPRPGALRRLFQRAATPYVRHVTAREMDEVTALIRAAEQPDLPTAAALLPALAAPASSGHYVPDRLDHDLRHHGLTAWVTEEFQARSERRAAAVLLAARLYQADHDGRPPATAAALVADYLPHVPADPVTGATNATWKLPATRPSIRR